jgi:hypothetical protein
MRILWHDLDHAVARRLVAKAEQRAPEDLSPEDLLSGVTLRGLVWHDATSNQHCGTAAGIVLLARDPSAVFPQCRILADAYRATEPDGDPRDHEDIRGPMPAAVDRALAFIERIRVPEVRLLVTPAVEARLNERQKQILARALEAGNVTSYRQSTDGWPESTDARACRDSGRAGIASRAPRRARGLLP